MADWNEGGADYTETAAGSKYVYTKGGKPYYTDDANKAIQEISRANGGETGDGMRTNN